jgi:DNA-binding transcriptional MocR family regulator
MSDTLLPASHTAREPHYLDVAQRIQDDIGNGALRPGARIPSVREMSRQTQRSVTTVLRAYEHLEACGAIESRPRSGYFVRSALVAAEPPPRTAAVLSGPPSLISTDLVSTVLSTLNQPDFFSFGHTVPAQALAPVAQLNRIARNLINTAPNLTVPYLMSPGYEKLRQQIAARLSAHRVATEPDDVIITSGALEAINLGIRMLTRPGDTILMESPTFYGLLQAAEEHGLRVIELPNDPQRGIDPDDLRRAVQRHRIACALLVQNFNNPTGSLMPEDAKREVVRTLNHAGIPLIEDDIYGELGFASGRATPLKAYDEADLVLYCSSVSKTVSSGLRVGWIASRRHARELTRRKFTLNCAAPSLSQVIVSRYLESGGHERHLRKVRTMLWQSIERFTATIQHCFPEGTRIARPQGGFVLWLELPRTVDAVTLFQAAARERVAICPGPLFSASGQYAHHIRLNCALPWTPQTEQALQTLGRVACALARLPAAAPYSVA